MNKIICDIFAQKEEYNLFPEELITFAAKEVLRARVITRASVEEYCKNKHRNLGVVVQMRRNHGIDVTDSPVFKLTRQQRRVL